MKSIEACVIAVIFLNFAVPFSLYGADISLSPAGVGEFEPTGGDGTFRTVVTEDNTVVANPGAVFTEGNTAGMTLPYLVSDPARIEYPRWALAQGWQGETVLAIEILTDGSVGRYSVMSASGHKTLDDAAVAAVQLWKFHLALEHGSPVVTCIQIPVRFEIKETA
ncbi:MAG: hypothetical protein A2Z83_04405 [Omnitrophica bacterium GWA2_52_8]|nr:MAG: hypothetical protein A2Z83_04405 [Omnitrophica bacterium GWA2_52_8]